MSSRSKYRTKQRDILLCYLKNMQGVHVTAGDICKHFREQKTPIGQSTVYRQLESLVDEGIVNKYTIDRNTPACFEYVGSGDVEAVSCFHCRCEKCGKLIHLECDELKTVQAHLLAEHHFKVDSVRTVIYGLCGRCLPESK